MIDLRLTALLDKRLINSHAAMFIIVRVQTNGVNFTGHNPQRHILVGQQLVLAKLVEIVI